MSKATRLDCLILGCCFCTAYLVGCGSEDSGPISSSNSKYQVADGTKPAASDGAQATSTDLANQETPEQSVRVSDAPTSGTVQGSVTAEPPAAQEATPVQGAYPIPETEQELLAFLENMQTQQPQGLTPQEQAMDMQNIQMAKILAADKLWEISKETETRLVAVRAKQEAMQMMMVMGAPDMEKEIRAHSHELMQDETPEIALLGRIARLRLALVDMANGQVEDVEAIVDEIKALVENGTGNQDVLTIGGQAAMLLQQRGQKAAAIETSRLVGNAFKDDADPQRAMLAQQLLDRAKIVEVDIDAKLNALMQGDSEAATQLVTALTGLIDDQETGLGAVLAARECLRYLEMTNHIAEGNQVLDLLEGALLTKLETDPSDPQYDMQVDQIKAELAQGRARLGLVGKPLTVEGILPDGSAFDWTPYQGKVVLVDFWATWCGPCLQEIPVVEQVYKQYKEQGFEVLGVNLDDDIQELRRFLFQPLPWTTIYSSDGEKVGFNSPMATKCGVNAIPFMVLLDRDGTVAAIHARGQRLEDELKRLLANAPTEEAAEPSEEAAAAPPKAADAPTEAADTPTEAAETSTEGSNEPTTGNE